MTIEFLQINKDLYKLKLDKERLNLARKKAEDDHNYKMKSLSKKPAKTS